LKINKTTQFIAAISQWVAKHNTICSK